MHRLILVVISFYFASYFCIGQQLSTQQEVWLYRIVHKTPILKNNWDDCFKFNTTPFKIEKWGNTQLDYQAISYYQLHNPQSLLIDYDKIKKSSQGLVAEAAIKLTLWELNEELKQCINTPINCNDSLFEQLTSPLNHRLPKNLRNKQREYIINTITHPSLPIFKKIEQLEDTKVDVQLQKQLLNTWSQIISDYSYRRSQHYFSILTAGQTLKSTTFLAAGEGSGTAGLLYEWETNPEDSTKRWYGKGIGLFTYQVRIHKEELRLQPHITKQLRLEKAKPMALHTSLFGLDSSFKPMIIVTDDTVSYHLFAISSESGLSPDKNLSKGISHIERIEEHRERNIIAPMKELQSNSLLDKTYTNKQLLEEQISVLQSEIDTLQKYEPDNTELINFKKRLIDAKLITLSKKEQRIKELERTLSAKYKAIANAEKKMDEMMALLGPSPQNWSKEGNIYKFSNGVVFNPMTQDLIFPAQTKEREIGVRLVSAGYTLEGKKKDEVQAYVTITQAHEKTNTSTKIKPITVDTTLVIHYFPDEFKTKDIQLDNNTIALLKSFKHHQYELGQLELSDTFKSHSINYLNRKREYQLPLTINAHNRKSHILLKATGDTLIISCQAHADPVATNLSKATMLLKEQLNISASTPDNNKYLVALRATHALKTLLLKLDIALPETTSNIINKDLPLNQQEIKILYEATQVE